MLRMLRHLLALAGLLIEALRFRRWLRTRLAGFSLYFKSTFGKRRLLSDLKVKSGNENDYQANVAHSLSSTSTTFPTDTSTTTTTTTIKELADIYRALLLSEMKPAQFAKECMEFDARVVPDGCCDVEGDLGVGDEQTSRVIGVLNQLAATGFDPPVELFPAVGVEILHYNHNHNHKPKPKHKPKRKTDRLNKVEKKIVVVEETAQERAARLRQHQLAVIWLDGHEFSAIKLNKLAIELERLRAIQSHTRLTAAEGEVASHSSLYNEPVPAEEEENENGWQSPSEGERDWETW